MWSLWKTQTLSTGPLSNLFSTPQWSNIWEKKIWSCHPSSQNCLMTSFIRIKVGGKTRALIKFTGCCMVFQTNIYEWIFMMNIYGVPASGRHCSRQDLCVLRAHDEWCGIHCPRLQPDHELPSLSTQRFLSVPFSCPAPPLSCAPSSSFYLFIRPQFQRSCYRKAFLDLSR